MSESMEFHGVPVDGARVMWIKKMRQRGGIYRELEDIPLELFGATDWRELMDNIIRAIHMVDNSMPMVAIANALGFEMPGSSVIERRQRLAPIYSISVRTVERLEDEGAKGIAYFIERMLEPDFLGRQHLALMRAIASIRWAAEKRQLEIPSDVWKTLEGAAWALDSYLPVPPTPDDKPFVAPYS